MKRPHRMGLDEAARRRPRQKGHDAEALRPAGWHHWAERARILLDGGMEGRMGDNDRLADATISSTCESFSLVRRRLSSEACAFSDDVNRALSNCSEF
jgi:hypothetical protein